MNLFKLSLKTILLSFFIANPSLSNENFTFFGIELGSEFNSSNQTINGKEFKFLNHREVEQKYNYRNVDSWTWLQGSDYIWVGTKMGDFEDVKMAFFEYEDEQFEKLTGFNFKFIRFKDGKEKIFMITADTNFKLNNLNECKKRQKYYFDMYSDRLNMTNKDKADELVYIKRGELGYAFNEDQSVSVALECYDKEFWIDITDNLLDDEALLLVD